MLPNECFDTARNLVSNRITKPNKKQIDEKDLLWALSESILLMFPRDCIAVIASSTLDGKSHLHRTFIWDDWTHIINSGLFFQNTSGGDSLKSLLDFSKVGEDPEKQLTAFVLNIHDYFKISYGKELIPHDQPHRLDCSFELCAENIVDEELAEIRYLYLLAPSDKAVFILFTSSLLSMDELRPLHTFLSEEIGQYLPILGAVSQKLLPFSITPKDFEASTLTYLDNICRKIAQDIFSNVGCREKIEASPIVSLLIDSDITGNRGFRHVPRVTLTRVLGTIGDAVFPSIRELVNNRSFSQDKLELFIHRKLNGLQEPAADTAEFGRIANEIFETIIAVQASVTPNLVDRQYISNAVPSLFRFLANYYEKNKKPAANWENELNSHLLEILLPRTDGTYSGGYCVFSVLACRYKFWYSWRNGPPSRFFKGHYHPQYLNIEEIYFPYPHVIYFPFFRSGSANIVLQIVTQNYMMCRRPEKLQNLLLQVTPGEVHDIQNHIDSLNAEKAHDLGAGHPSGNLLMAVYTKRVFDFAKHWEAKSVKDPKKQYICLREEVYHTDNIVKRFIHAVESNPSSSYDSITKIHDKGKEDFTEDDYKWVLNKIIEGERTSP